VQRVTELGQPRPDGALDGRPELGPQLVGIDAVGDPDRRHHGIVLDRDGERALELVERLAHGELRRDPSAVRGVAHALGELVEVDTDRVELAGHLLRDRRVGHGQEPEHQRQLHLKTADGVGRESGERRFREVGVRRRGRDHDLAGHGVLLVEAGHVDVLGAADEAAQRGHDLLLRLAAALLVATDLGVVTQHVPPGRLLVPQGLPVVVRQDAQVVAHARVLPREVGSGQT
jgi:hypothetical protein